MGKFARQENEISFLEDFNFKLTLYIAGDNIMTIIMVEQFTSTIGAETQSIQELAAVAHNLAITLQIEYDDPRVQRDKQVSLAKERIGELSKQAMKYLPTDTTLHLNRGKDWALNYTPRNNTFSLTMLNADGSPRLTKIEDSPEVWLEDSFRVAAVIGSRLESVQKTSSVE